MTAVYHSGLIQGSDEWHQARCGLLTASEMHLIVTPTLKLAQNEKTRAHLYELLAQRVTRYVEPSYVGDNMLRGWEDEVEAALIYSKKRAQVDAVGFVTNDKWGFTLGYSPDGLVGKDGLIECKSRRQKFQTQTIIECVPEQKIPIEFLAQVQTGLLVADDRQWLDFISYCGGMGMVIIRVHPDPAVQDVLINAAGEFERQLAEKLAIYEAAARDLIPTERKIIQEMYA